MPPRAIAAAKLAACTAAALLAAGTSHAVAASKFKNIHSFCRLSNGCKDGAYPSAQLVEDGHGVFYGTTYSGGKHGGGVVFALTPNGAKYDYSILYNFCSKGGSTCSDGSTPNGYLVLDTGGSLYGLVSSGGKYNDGLAFELKNTGTGWTFVPLYEFCPQRSTCPDGQFPAGGLTYQGQQSGAPYDGTAPLYGVASSGGGADQGTLFELTTVKGKAARHQRVLYSFCAKGGSACTDGSDPASVIADGSGNLFGITDAGGAADSGIVFELPKSKTTTTALYSFCQESECADGGFPSGSLVLDAGGDLIGTTTSGGSNDDGALFRVVPNGTKSKYAVLYSFCQVASCTDGRTPQGLTIAADGTIYGVTDGGGQHSLSGGTVYRLKGGKEAVLYSFCATSGCPDGQSPASIILDAKGDLFGTSDEGGAYASGVVFRVTP